MRFFAKGVLVCVLATFVCVSAQAAERVTFTKDVLPILQENCQSCHRVAGANIAGMVAPMSLMTYREVRPWSKAISRVVANRDMPPWDATELTHGVFRNERTLTQEQIDTLVQWVEDGASRGNPADAPAPIEFTQDGWALSNSLGEPDMILEMPEPYWVADEVQDVQPRMTIKLTKEQMPEMRWVRAIEYRPGSEVVHHIVGNSTRPEDEGSLSRRSNFGQIASGTDPPSFDEGYGLPLYPESTISLSMHYHKEAGPGTGVWDQSSVAVWFQEGEILHPLESSTISYGGFEIPPNHPNWRVVGSRTWDEPFRILEFLPHMHLRGKSAKYTAFYPDGTNEVLLDIPNYDYAWQTSYEFDEYKDIPGGTRIEYEIIYDNSPEMAEARNFNPNRSVRFGGPTTEEMDLGWLTWCYQEEGKVPDSWLRSSNASDDDDDKEETD